MLLPIKPHKSPEDAADKAWQALEASKVLVRLYFPDAIPRFEAVQTALSPVIEYYRTAARLPPNATIVDRGQRAYLIAAIGELQNYLITNLECLTKDPVQYVRWIKQIWS